MGAPLVKQRSPIGNGPWHASPSYSTDMAIVLGNHHQYEHHRHLDLYPCLEGRAGRSKEEHVITSFACIKKLRWSTARAAGDEVYAAIVVLLDICLTSKDPPFRLILIHILSPIHILGHQRIGTIEEHPATIIREIPQLSYCTPSTTQSASPIPAPAPKAALPSGCTTHRHPLPSSPSPRFQSSCLTARLTASYRYTPHQAYHSPHHGCHTQSTTAAT